MHIKIYQIIELDPLFFFTRSSYLFFYCLTLTLSHLKIHKIYVITFDRLNQYYKLCQCYKNINVKKINL